MPQGYSNSRPQAVKAIHSCSVGSRNLYFLSPTAPYCLVSHAQNASASFQLTFTAGWLSSSRVWSLCRPLLCAGLNLRNWRLETSYFPTSNCIGASQTSRNSVSSPSFKVRSPGLGRSSAPNHVQPAPASIKKPAKAPAAIRLVILWNMAHLLWLVVRIRIPGFECERWHFSTLRHCFPRPAA